MTKLSPNQIETMKTLSNHVGEEVWVLTSQATANVPSSFVRKAVTTTKKPTLAGLEKKGYIKIVSTYWKGATIKILKGYDDDI